MNIVLFGCSGQVGWDPVLDWDLALVLDGFDPGYFAPGWDGNVNGRITTTLPKAKRLRPLAERLITLAKRGDLHNRRRVMRVIRNKSVVHKLFTEIAEQMEQREGGYTRIVKIAPRRGDAAPAAIIELVTEPVSPKQAVVKEAEAATKVAAAEAPEAAAEEATAENAE